MSAPAPIARNDRTRIYAAAFLRALATGMIGVTLGIHLAAVGLDPARIGLVVAAGLAGGAAATMVAAARGDHLRRRRFLVTLAALGVGGALAAGVLRHPAALAVAAFLGMLNGMGRDRGAALAVEQAVLPATAADRDRTRVIAWYNVLQDAGHATGSLAAGLPSLLRGVLHVSEASARMAPFVFYAVLMLMMLALYLGLSTAIERAPHAPHSRVAPDTRRLVLRISSLFALDSLGGGFLTTALVSYFFFSRFGAGEGVIALLFFGARVANAFSHLGAAWLAARIGLVNTMVFTHIPSSFLLVTVAFAPNFPIAALLFLLREGLVEMDVPTRQSYVMAVVRPEERLYASGVTSLVRTGAWAVAPSFAGFFMRDVSLAAPLFIGAGLKIAYDVMLYFAFRRLRPPEER